ncbi:MAG: amidase [Roseibium sp.]
MTDTGTSAERERSPSAGRIAEEVRTGKTSARQATLDALARIESLDGPLRAFCTLHPDAALEQADRVDERLAAGERPGPLAGVPVAVKDLIATKDLRTTFGSPLYASHLPDEDDVVVARLRQAGAIIIGKTNTSEFGYGAVGHNPLFATTRNPWHVRRTPGGSSAGSAAAVASGMVPVALGSDGGGSVRIPAALTGILGFKPSWGRLPLYPGCRDEKMPGASGWESLEHIGPLTRSVADAALVMSALSGPSSRDRHSLPLEAIDWGDLSPLPLKGSRLAFSPDLGFAKVDPEVAAVAGSAAQDLAEALDCRLDLAAPEVGDTQPVFETLVALDTDRRGLIEMADRANHTFASPLRELLDRRWTADEFTAAIVERKRIANAMWRFMDPYRFLLTPSVSVTAFDLDIGGPAEIAGTRAAATDWTPFSALANLTGQPALSVPAGFTSEGLPVGLQIIGRHLDDAGVLRAAAALESVRPWSHLWPD